MRFGTEAALGDTMNTETVTGPMTQYLSSASLAEDIAREEGRAAGYRWLDAQERATAAQMGWAPITSYRTAAEHCSRVAGILRGGK